MMRRVVSFAFGVGVCLCASSGFAVDGLREINQSNVSGDLSVLHIIDQPGSYRLTSDLLVPAGRNGIDINTNDVTLDLNGFTIRGAGGAGTARGIALGTGTNIEIKNGTVRDIPGSGIYATSATAVRVIDVRVLNVDDVGINLEAGAMPPFGQHLVRGCTVRGSGAEGVRLLGAGGLAQGNLLRDNTLVGLVLSSSGAFGGNVITENNGGGSQVMGGVAIACNLMGMVANCP
jgi:hypothetical protein